MEACTTPNIGRTERVLRAVVGIGIISLTCVATVALGWCPPYALLGINTCGVKKPQSENGAA